MKNLGEVIEQMKIDLAWRGPTGRPLGHIVLPRQEAELLIFELEKRLVAERIAVA